MKTNASKLNAVKKTTARKKVVDAQEQVDSQLVSSRTSLNQEEFHRQIANKAYELFERRGFRHGFDVEDWYQAERLVQEGL